MTEIDRSYRLVAARTSDVHARSRGAITKNPVAYDLMVDARGVARPEKGGFCCSSLFGPLGAPDPEAFAHFELAEPVAHPLVDGESLSTLAVLPLCWRRPTQVEGGWREHDLTRLYNELYSTTRRQARLLELAAPAPIVEQERGVVRAALARLFDNDFAAEPLVYRGAGRPSSLASLLATDDAQPLEATLFALGLRLI